MMKASCDRRQSIGGNIFLKSLHVRPVTAQVDRCTAREALFCSSPRLRGASSLGLVARTLAWCAPVSGYMLVAP
jgi:hypothetical protein